MLQADKPGRSKATTSRKTPAPLRPLARRGRTPSKRRVAGSRRGTKRWLERPLWTPVERQVLGVCLVAAAVIGAAGFFWDVTGPVGRALAYWSVFVAGGGAFSVWALVCYVGVGLLFPRRRLAGRRRVLGLAVLVLMWLFWLQLGLDINSRLPADLTWNDEIAGLPSYADFLAHGINGAGGTGGGRSALGGGIVGAFLAYYALKLFWRAGSYVVLAAGAASGLLLALGPGGRRLVAGWVRRVATWTRDALRELKEGFLGEAADLAGAFENEASKSDPGGRYRVEPGDADSRGGAGGQAAQPAQGREYYPDLDDKKTTGGTPGVEGGAGTGPAGTSGAGRPEAPPRQGTAEAGAMAQRGGFAERGPAGGREGGPTQAASHGGLAQLSLWADNTAYRLPPLSLLSRPRQAAPKRSPDQDQSDLLVRTLGTFGIEARVVNVDRGPVVTRYELQPAPGVKVSRILSLSDDIALALAAAGVRIEAPIPGKSAIGIEVPNREVSVVHLREVLESGAFQNNYAKLLLGLGKDIAGQPVVADLARMPHLLIAGATGSGKSVCMNTLIASILFRARPNEVKLLLVDPKRVELAVYDGIPHLVAPVVTDPRKAAAALRSMVEEMENRYRLFAAAGVRNMEKYNELVAVPVEQDEEPDTAAHQEGQSEGGPARPAGDSPAAPRPLPYIVVFIDELADLMMVAAADVEDAICRLAQMARAAGIHLVIATQRPSVDVITGLIKANIPSRIAFAVSSQVDSRTILDHGGAELLLGRGDMLFLPAGAAKARRVQGAYMTDREVEELVEFWKSQGAPEFLGSVANAEESPVEGEADDELFDDAVKLVVSAGQASVSLIQRRFRVGYARAARLIDMMEVRGIVGPYQGSKPREVLIAKDDDDTA